MLYFLPSSLHGITLYLTLGTICKQIAVLWQPSMHHHTPIYYWTILKENLCTHLSKGSH